MRNTLLASLVAILAIGTAAACSMDGKTGIVEENTMNIPVGLKSNSNVTEEDFNKIIEDIETIYAPIIEAEGKTLQIERRWEDGTVNAYAQQSGNTWKVSMFGGLARHEAITKDGFATVVCHELGHHLGGAPKKSSWYGASWASNEGQADYFGTMKCLRKYMEKDNNIKIVKTLRVPALVTKKCSANFTDSADIATCKRVAMAGLSLGTLFKDLRGLTTDLSFSTPDSKVVTKTNHNHPMPQCRLDTYFAGAICDKDHYSDVSNTDANEGVCSRTEGKKDGIRPLCWYKPETI